MSQVRTGSALAAILKNDRLAAACGLKPENGTAQRVEITVQKSGPTAATINAIPPALRLLIKRSMIESDHVWIADLKPGSKHRLIFGPNTAPDAAIDGWPERDTRYLLDIEVLVARGKKLCAALERAVNSLNQLEIGKFDKDVARLCNELATRLLGEKQLNEHSYNALLRSIVFVTEVGPGRLPLDIHNRERDRYEQFHVQIEGVGPDAGPLTGAYLDHLLTKLMHERGLAMYGASVARAIENHGEVLHTDNHRRTRI